MERHDGHFDREADEQQHERPPLRSMCPAQIRLIVERRRGVLTDLGQRHHVERVLRIFGFQIVSAAARPSAAAFVESQLIRRAA
ncbi:MAG: hypothetical protein QM811_07380 [Pirellulales bacterium]